MDMAQKNNAKNNPHRSIGKIAVWLGLILLCCMEFVLHRKVVFMMDDLWYSTNLATGAPLRDLGDVVESQIWHFKNWGGRNVTHGILQLVLMAGEWAADILNLLMTLLLGFMVCQIAETAIGKTVGTATEKTAKKFAGSGKLWLFLTAETLLICLNANVKMSMFWQSGTVNYVYSTVWLLFFLWVYLRQLNEPSAAPLPGAAVWMPILGLAAGWSNENMGPACTLTALVITIYLLRAKRRMPQPWMIEGIMTSMVGSLLVIIAPGNFVRVDAIEKVSLGESVFQRVYSILCATGIFLFPTLVIMGGVILIHLCFCKGHLSVIHWVLLLTALAAHGAMFLSPHYPDRATFGIMALCITVTISLLSRIWEQQAKFRKWIVGLLASCFLFAVLTLSQYLFFTDLIIGA